MRAGDAAFALHAAARRRPPLDRINALLSFLYAMLGHDCRSALEAHGLDPQVGFLHADRPGRASLALDLMEELRPVLADRLALSLINRRQLVRRRLRGGGGGGVRLTDDARKTVLIAWQERKRDELRHPFLDETDAAGPGGRISRRSCWRATCAAISTAIRPSLEMSRDADAGDL